MGGPHQTLPLTTAPSWPCVLKSQESPGPAQRGLRCPGVAHSPGTKRPLWLRPLPSSPSPQQLLPPLLPRIMQQLQRLLVLGDLAPTLTDKLTHFFRSVPLPPHCFSFTNS